MFVPTGFAPQAGVEHQHLSAGSSRLCATANTKSYGTQFCWNGSQLIEITIGSWRRRLAKLFELATVTGGHPYKFCDTFAVEPLLSAVPMERVSILF
jgi:hypothetical protein